MVAKAKEYRERMIEKAVEMDDAAMEAYLEGKEPDMATLIKCIRKGTIESKLYPMMCGSAFKNKGVQAMLDAVIDYLPSPVDIPPVKGAKENGEPDVRKPEDDEPFAALAFKIMTDPFVGQLIFFRVYSGVVNSGDTIFNPVKGKKERVGRMVQMHANQRDEIKEVLAGDIAAGIGFKDCTTGDTLCALDHVIVLERMENKGHARRLREDYLRSLMAASLARELCSNPREAEEAFLGAMFHHLGRSLAEFYFPEEAEAVRRLARARGTL